MSDFVSVVTPTYNRAYCLTRAIDSALSQTHKALEVIVVDDGSTDGTEELVRSRYGAESRLRYLRQANSGVTVARNRALEVARGDYIAFLDSDDVWKPWKVEMQLACLRSHPAVGMIWSDMEAVGPDGTVVAARYLRTMYSAYRWFTLGELFQESVSLDSLIDLPDGGCETHCFYVGDIYSAMVMGNLVHTSTVLLRRDRFEKVKSFDEALSLAGEDYDFHLRTSREGLVGFANVATIQYQIGMPDRLTRHRNALARNFLSVLTRVLEHDRNRITLPTWMINETVANAHTWLAETLVEDGDSRGARPYYWASLRRKPWQPRTYAQIILGLMPQHIEQALRDQYSRIKLLGRESSF